MMMNKNALSRLFNLIIIISLLLIPTRILPQNPSDAYISHYLTSQNGLPQNTIYAVTQDSDGYIWIGTDEGVVRFDGIKFQHFNKLNTKHIKNNSITSLFVAHDGTLWIGTFGGGITLYHPKEKTFTSHTTQNGLSNDFIWTITEDREQNILLGTVGGGLIRFKDNRFDSFSTAHGLSNNIVNAIFEDHTNTLWIGTENGLDQLNPDSTIKVYTTRNGLADNNIMAVREDNRGILWIGTANGLTAIRGDTFITFTTRDGLSNNLVRAIHQDKQGNLWIATDGGLNRIVKGDRFPATVGIEPFGSTGDRVANSLMTIFEDREENLWIGSSGDGLTILHQRKLRTLTVKDGLARHYTKAVFQDAGGTVWIGTNGGGLNRLKDGNIKTYTTDHGLGGNFINSICGDEQGNLWVGTGRGLSLYNPGKDAFFTYPRQDGLPSNAIHALYHDHAGNLWIGTYGGGLIRFHKKDNTFFTYTVQNGLSNNFILSIAEDGENRLWVGTNKGLNRLENDKIKTYTRADGLSDDIIYDIYPGPGGVLWLGTNGGGLNRFDYKNGTFTHYTRENGLLSNVISRVIEDGGGNLWMSSNQGICTVSIRELNFMAAGKRSYLNWKFFGEADGMESPVCSGGFQPAGMKTRDGRLWFPTIKGIVVIDPRTIKYNRVEPPVFIERLVVDGVTRLSHISIMSPLRGQPIRFPSDTEKIKISFTALSFTAPRKVRFRYRLKGYNDNWFETGSREQVEYSDLPPGRYTFEVIACNNDGLWNTRRTTAKFVIKHPFHETIGFYLIVVLVLILGGLWLFRLPERRAKQKMEEDRKYEASTLTPAKVRTYSHKLVKLMEEDKQYLDPDLSAAALAESLGISRKHLSQVINQQFHLNFKNFVNRYRVEEAKKRLLDPKEQDFVLLKIALDVGFNSKSVFNEAFKKFTGMSPSEYRKNKK